MRRHLVSRLVGQGPRALLACALGLLACALGLLACALGLLACSGASKTAPVQPPAPPPPPASAPLQLAHILFDGQPFDATLTVDGEPRGSLAENARKGGLTLPFGVHRFEVWKKGYQPYRIELDLGKTVETIRIELQRIRRRR